MNMEKVVSFGNNSASTPSVKSCCQTSTPFVPTKSGPALDGSIFDSSSTHDKGDKSNLEISSIPPSNDTSRDKDASQTEYSNSENVSSSVGILDKCFLQSSDNIEPADVSSNHSILLSNRQSLCKLEECESEECLEANEDPLKQEDGVTIDSNVVPCIQSKAVPRGMVTNTNIKAADTTVSSDDAADIGGNGETTDSASSNGTTGGNGESTDTASSNETTSGETTDATSTSETTISADETGANISPTVTSGETTDATSTSETTISADETGANTVPTGTTGIPTNAGTTFTTNTSTTSITGPGGTGTTGTFFDVNTTGIGIVIDASGETTDTASSNGSITDTASSNGSTTDTARRNGTGTTGTFSNVNTTGANGIGIAICDTSSGETTVTASSNGSATDTASNNGTGTTGTFSNVNTTGANGIGIAIDTSSGETTDSSSSNGSSTDSSSSNGAVTDTASSNGAVTDTASNNGSASDSADTDVSTTSSATYATTGTNADTDASTDTDGTATDASTSTTSIADNDASNSATKAIAGTATDDTTCTTVTDAGTTDTGTTEAASTSIYIDDKITQKRTDAPTKRKRLTMAEKRTQETLELFGGNLGSVLKKSETFEERLRKDKEKQEALADEPQAKKTRLQKAKVEVDSIFKDIPLGGGLEPVPAISNTQPSDSAVNPPGKRMTRLERAKLETLQSFGGSDLDEVLGLKKPKKAKETEAGEDPSIEHQEEEKENQMEIDC